MATTVAGAVPITQFTPAQQASLRSGVKVGNYQVINGHVMDLRSPNGQALLAQRNTITTTAPPAPTTADGSTAPAVVGPGRSRFPGSPAGFPTGPVGQNKPPALFPSAASGAGDQATQDAKDAANRDAQAQIVAVLQQYGLESLAGFTWQEIVSGRSGNEVLQDIRETPQFKQRFPAIDMRQKAGLPPLSPGDYVSYENTATQYMRDAGLPKGFYDNPEDFTKFLANDVSLKELAERVNLAKDAAYNAPTEVRSALRGQFGLGDGDLAAFFLDPNRAQPLLQRTYNAAQIAGAGTRTGYNVNAEQDYRLADLGVSVDQAQSGFSQLQQSQELFNPLTGHANEGAITTDQQLGAAFGGNAADQQLVERRRQERQAEFQDGGGFAATQQGLGGLGSASK